VNSIIFKKGPFDSKWTRDDGQSETRVSKEDMSFEMQKLLNAGWYMNSWGMFTRNVVLFKRATRGYGQS
jgi:hypothetical protein